MDNSTRALRLREVIVLGALSLLFFFWVIPITGLAGLLSYKEIKKTMPWLGHLIDSNEKIRAIVQNSLPSAAMITLNALLPFVLEGSSSFLLYGSRINAVQLSPIYKDSAPGVWSSTHS
jgi:calcium permeable stress-gated cation channel